MKLHSMVLLERALLNNLEEEVRGNNEQIEGLKIYASLCLHANEHKQFNQYLWKSWMKTLTLTLKVMEHIST